MAVVSIIVPVYNRKEYIRRCLDSILRQTYKDFELIVVDDGSNDGTGDICDKYGEKNSEIKVIHQKNGGVSKARNIGIDNVEGRFCIFIDSDDYVPPNYLLNFIKAYEEYGEGFVFIASYKVEEEQNVQYIRYKEERPKSVLQGNEIFELISMGGLFNAVNNKMYQVQLLKEHNIRFPEKIDLGEDLIFNLRYCDKNGLRFVVLNNNFYCYCGLKGRNSLEQKLRENFYQIQRLLLREKKKYILKWESEGKIPKKSEEYQYVWYADFIYKNVDHYIVNTINGNMSFGMFIKNMSRLNHSPEYFKYVQLNHKTGFVKWFLHRFFLCLKDELKMKLL